MSKPEKKLFLLDALALIYRAHFAFSKNPRVSSKGLNTSAVFGFTNALLEILQKEAPTHLGVAFDTHAPTFRHETFEAYKAHREEQPEDIRVAIPIIKEMLKGFQIPVLEMDGYEADDIIGTLAKQASKAGFEVFMMTPDKDYAQLVEEHVYLYKPAYMGNGVDILGIKEVLEKFEIDQVDQVRDILGLQGDAVDNIPGIPGVGAKTAVKLLKEFGTVENLVANADQLKGAIQQKVKEFGHQGILSKALATIKIDVPIAFEPDALVMSKPDESVLRPLFEELEFRSIANRVFNKEVAGTPVAAKKAPSNQMDMFASVPAEKEADETRTQEGKATIGTTHHQYHIVDTLEGCQELAKKLAQQKEFCFDTETTALEVVEAELVGLAFAWQKGEAWYVPVPEDRKTAQQIADVFKPVLESSDITIIGQNLKYDIQVMRNYGVRLQGPIFDTMLAHYLLDPETPHKMDVLAENYLNYKPVPIEDLIGKKGAKQGNMRDVEVKDAAEYAGEDADITLQLKHVLGKAIENRNLGKLLHEVEEPLSFVLADMEYTGVSIDIAALGEMSKELNQLSIEAQEDIYRLAGTNFNIASPKQLGEILFERMKLIDKPKKTKTGQYATGEDILSKLANEHEIAAKILEFREYQKLKSTYVDALPKLVSPVDNRIHTDYRQAVAATGRLSSNNPNLQNIPIRTAKGREIRKAFVPRSDEFVIMSADYSQIELRIMAEFSQDASMLAAFKEGRDIHATTASKVFKVPLEEVEPAMRRKAKEVNFGIIYGISAFGLSQNLNIPRSEASDIITAYFEEFPAVKAYMDKVIADAHANEYVETILGRRRYLRDINSQNQTLRGYAERNAINAPIQGSAADMIKVAMVQVHHWMVKENLRSKMIMQVHDELVFEAHRDELMLLKENVTHFMKTAIPLQVPMEIGIGEGKNWLEAH